MYWPFTILLVLYCALIFWLSGQPEPPTPTDLFPHFDKLQHLVAFGIMGGIVLMGMKLHRRPYALSRLLWWPVVFVFLFSLTDEYHQSFTPKRQVDPLDVVANTLGALIAAWILLRLVFHYSAGELRRALRLQ